MEQYSKYIILDIIRKTGSVMPLFNSGYSYSLIYNWCKELEDEKLVVREDDGKRSLTVNGKKCLDKLKAYKQRINIIPLYNVHVDKMGTEEVYIPRW